MRLLAHVAAASLTVLSLGACTDKQVPTSMPVGARSNAAAPPPGGGTQPPRPPFPFPRSDPNDIVEITAGDSHTCARTYDFRVFCWGADNVGQAGMWSSTTCAWAGGGGVPCVNRPTFLTLTLSTGGTTDLKARTIDAGSSHTCMLDMISDAYCWGWGSQGQLGVAVGSYIPMYGATKVAGGVKFSLISAGGQSTCGSGSSGVFCWGVIANNAAVPTAVSGYNYSVDLSVGERHACIIDGTGAGIVYCWGNNQYGQLSRDPVMVPSALFGAIQSTFYYARHVTTQQSFTCIERSDGAAECAGLNTSGQLGYGQTGTPAAAGQPQIVGSGMQLHGLSTGGVHACALDSNNMAWCWGIGWNGQLGNGVSGAFNTPQPVTGGRTYRAIAAGSFHTCAIGTDNHIYCWGENHFGQLGTQGPLTWVSNPVQALDPVIQVQYPPS